MSKIKTYKGMLAVGEQEKIHLSTNDGLTGYRINMIDTISRSPGDGDVEHILQVFTTDQTGSISALVDFSNSDLLAVAYNKEQSNSTSPGTHKIIFDKETINQDIFVTLTDAAGGTIRGNFYIELEQFKLDINSSTYHTLKNIRSKTQ